MGRFCRHAVETGATAIICASGGNAGFAAAYAGQRLGVPVTIIVPATTSAEAMRAIQAMGAKDLIAYERRFEKEYRLCSPQACSE